MQSRVFRSLLLVVTLLLTFIGSVSNPKGSGADDARGVSTTTREGRLAVFDDVWETIDERYYDPSFRGIDWLSRRATFRPLAANANGTQEFYEVLRRMIAPLKDPHTRVYSPEEKSDWWKPTFINVGLSIREIDGQVTVVQVESASPAHRAGIQAGDVIRKIDNVPLAQMLESRLQQYGPEIDQGTRFRAVTTLMEGTPGTSLKVEWQDRTGKVKSATLERKRIERLLGFRIESNGEWTILKVDAFTARVVSELQRQLGDTLTKSRGVILDLRANGGGDADAMSDVASFFLPKGTDLGKFSDRAGVSFELHANFRTISTVSSTLHTTVPLVVLTSESTSSAAEILAAALQKERRARLIGTRTCGCVLAIRNRHTLPDGGILDVSELDYWTNEGVRLEGAGVTPDEVVKTERRDLYSHRDAVLDRAKARLRQLIK